mmetsp:Transcript_46669/g.149020  ORF Transcript_46669/g.149020 Transcript_46669/m.149020 type:complete len:341 (+) Transcript_46669:55-1077(+)
MALRTAGCLFLLGASSVLRGVFAARAAPALEDAGDGSSHGALADCKAAQDRATAIGVKRRLRQQKVAEEADADREVERLHRDLYAHTRVAWEEMERRAIQGEQVMARLSGRAAEAQAAWERTVQGRCKSWARPRPRPPARWVPPAWASPRSLWPKASPRRHCSNLRRRRTRPTRRSTRPWSHVPRTWKPTLPTSARLHSRRPSAAPTTSVRASFRTWPPSSRRLRCTIHRASRLTCCPRGRLRRPLRSGTWTSPTACSASKAAPCLTWSWGRSGASTMPRRTLSRFFCTSTRRRRRLWQSSSGSLPSAGGTWIASASEPAALPMSAIVDTCACSARGSCP